MTLTSQSINLFSELASWGKGRFKILDKKDAEKRLEICIACENFEKDGQRCLKCGCFMQAKIYLATSSCPIGKWQKASTD